MAVSDEIYSIELDIDRDRIKTILQECYRICEDTLGVKFLIDSDKFVSKINVYLKSNRVAVPVYISLPSKKYPELTVEVDIRNRKLIARMGNRKMRILLNRYLTKL